MPYTLSYKRYGEYAILIEWPKRINEAIFLDLSAFKIAIELQLNKNIKTVLTAYNSIVVIYKPAENLKLNDEVALLKLYYSKKQILKSKPRRIWRIPVCYDLSYGIDLKGLSEIKKMSANDIIKRHCTPNYLVYFKGFLPGFVYLGGLDPLLFHPRKEKPRLRIAQGAVAIGGEQTGIYPNESPGGWNIIGNSPIRFFDVKKEKPCFARNGDYLKFYEINRKQHRDIKTLVNAGVYELEYEFAQI